MSTALVPTHVTTLTKENLKAVVAAGGDGDDKSDPGSSGKGSDSGSISDSSSDTDSTTSSEDRQGLTLRKAVKTAGKVGKELKKLFVNYGPPYRKYRGPDDIATAMLQDNLLNECCKPEAYLTEIHSLLNKRVNPNYRDEYDLFYTALHWCARRCHLRAMRMLRRAKAEVNILNEFGQSPLILSVLSKQPPPMTHKQQKTIKYLIDQGALINLRDRGGYCALDYAVMNQDIFSIRTLLDNGADLIRDNKILVAQRKHILSLATDPDCKALIKRELARAEKQRAEEEAVKALEDEALADADKRRLRMEDDIRNREARAVAEKEAEIKEYRDRIMSDRMDRIHGEMSGLLRPRPPRPGLWTKENQPGHWGLKRRDDEFVNIENKVYGECSRMMKDLRDANREEMFSKRWHEKSGGQLEMEWNRDKRFVTEEKSSVLGLPSSDPLDFRDENDEELEGEDLDMLLGLK